MVKLCCSVVGTARDAFFVTIDDNDSVGELKKAIKKKKKNYLKAIDANNLQLYLAKRGDAWLTEKEVKLVTDTNGLTHLGFARPKLADVGLSEQDVLHELDKDDVAAGKGPVNVLVSTEGEVRPHKKTKTATAIQYVNIESIEKNLDIDAWQVGGISLNICHVESDFPKWFYVRKETLDIIKIFKYCMRKKRNILFWGSPGGGKSMLVVFFAFYMALRQKKRVVLFRRKMGIGSSMLYLDTEMKNCWRMDPAGIEDLDLQLLNGAELCLDGFQKSDIKNNFNELARFRLLATSVQYDIKDEESVGLSPYLVPFWSSSDLNTIGAHLQWSNHKIKERYFYSGGNLRDFLSEKIDVTESIDRAVSLVDLYVAQLLNTQSAIGSVSQVDRLRMTGIRANDQSGLDKYLDIMSWCCLITSEYALRKLSKIVKASYYKELWSNGRMLGDNGLMDIAFENYVHTMARDGKKIEMQVRAAYDREKASQHTYFVLEFEAKLYRNEGTNEAECDAIMKQLASSSEDYWYPTSRSLVAIDSVAKLNWCGQQNVVGLIQITKSERHTINLDALHVYAGFLSNDCRYIVLVPDKETCDAFRFDLVDPSTSVPLYVAYMTNFVG